MMCLVFSVVSCFSLVLEEEVVIICVFISWVNCSVKIDMLLVFSVSMVLLVLRLFFIISVC